MAAQLRIARAVVGLAAVALTSSSAVQTRGLAAVPGEQDRLPLAPEAAIERELSTGQRHADQLTAAAGDFIKITVEQKGLDVVVTLLRPDGSGLLTVNASHEAFRPETLV